MGVEYRLANTRTGEAYDLGKTAMRAPDAHWETRIAGLDPLRDAAEWHGIMFPSERAMCRIGSEDGNFREFVLADRWTSAELAGLINAACLDRDDRTYAMRVALDVLEWAGRESVIMIPDTLDEDDVTRREGLDMPPMRIVRTIYDIERNQAA